MIKEQKVHKLSKLKRKRSHYQPHRGPFMQMHSCECVCVLLCYILESLYTENTSSYLDHQVDEFTTLFDTGAKMSYSHSYCNCAIVELP